MAEAVLPFEPRADFWPMLTSVEAHKLCDVLTEQLDEQLTFFEEMGSDLVQICLNVIFESDHTASVQALLHMLNRVISGTCLPLHRNFILARWFVDMSWRRHMHAAQSPVLPSLLVQHTRADYQPYRSFFELREKFASSPFLTQQAVILSSQLI